MKQNAANFVHICQPSDTARVQKRVFSSSVGYCVIERTCEVTGSEQWAIDSRKACVGSSTASGCVMDLSPTTGSSLSACPHRPPLRKSFLGWQLSLSSVFAAAFEQKKILMFPWAYSYGSIGFPKHLRSTLLLTTFAYRVSFWDNIVSEVLRVGYDTRLDVGWAVLPCWRDNTLIFSVMNTSYLYEQ